MGDGCWKLADRDIEVEGLEDLSTSSLTSG